MRLRYLAPLAFAAAVVSGCSVESVDTPSATNVADRDAIIGGISSWATRCPDDGGEYCTAIMPIELARPDRSGQRDKLLSAGLLTQSDGTTILTGAEQIVVATRDTQDVFALAPMGMSTETRAHRPYFADHQPAAGAEIQAVTVRLHPEIASVVTDGDDDHVVVRFAPHPTRTPWGEALAVPVGAGAVQDWKMTRMEGGIWRRDEDTTVGKRAQASHFARDLGFAALLMLGFFAAIVFGIVLVSRKGIEAWRSRNLGKPGVRGGAAGGRSWVGVTFGVLQTLGPFFMSWFFSRRNGPQQRPGLGRQIHEPERGPRVDITHGPPPV